MQKKCEQISFQCELNWHFSPKANKRITRFIQFQSYKERVTTDNHGAESTIQMCFMQFESKSLVLYIEVHLVLN